MMSEESRHRRPDLPDAEIATYLPPGVPLRWPEEQITSTDRALARLHRTMVVGHARICAALDELAESRRRRIETKWDQGMADLITTLKSGGL
jgi:hypothetical protein